MKKTADEGEDGDDHSEDYKFRFQEDDFDYCEQDDSDYEEEKRRREEEETCPYERSMKDMILGGNSSYDWREETKERKKILITHFICVRVGRDDVDCVGNENSIINKQIICGIHMMKGTQAK